MYSFTNQPLTFLAVEYAERVVLFFFTAVRLAGQTLYGCIQELMLYFSQKYYSKRQGELGPK